MELGGFYPEPAALCLHENRVLEHLYNSPYIREKHGRFASDAKAFFDRNRKSDRFEFSSWLEVSHSEVPRRKGNLPNVRLIVGGLIDRHGADYDNVSYCLAVCNARTGAVWRKFHFDVTVASASRRQPHPRCHLQYGGKMIPAMTASGIRRTQLEPLFPLRSEPRIFSMPMSLALVIDMAFREFPDPNSRKFLSAPEWRSIIRRHEALLLEPFFNKCLEVLKQGKTRPTLADAFYVS